LLRQCKW